MTHHARRLYVTVITTIRGFGELLWTDVVAQMDTMNDTVLAFQAQAQKLPKARPPIGLYNNALPAHHLLPQFRKYAWHVLSVSFPKWLCTIEGGRILALKRLLSIPFEATQ